MAESKSVKPTPSKLVVTAILDLNQPNGSSGQDIINYACSKLDVNQPNMKNRIQAALKRGVLFNVLAFENGLYKLTDPNLASSSSSSFSKRRRKKRGRCPKTKKRVQPEKKPEAEEKKEETIEEIKVEVPKKKTRKVPKKKKAAKKIDGRKRKRKRKLQKLVNVKQEAGTKPEEKKPAPRMRVPFRDRGTGMTMSKNSIETICRLLQPKKRKSEALEDKGGLSIYKRLRPRPIPKTGLLLDLGPFRQPKRGLHSRGVNHFLFRDVLLIPTS